MTWNLPRKLSRFLKSRTFFRRKKRNQRLRINHQKRNYQKWQSNSSKARRRDEALAPITTIPTWNIRLHHRPRVKKTTISREDHHESLNAHDITIPWIL